LQRLAHGFDNWWADLAVAFALCEALAFPMALAER